MTRVIAIVAGETSGDNLGASFIAAMKKRDPDLHFVGVGGPKMQHQGCEILYDMERIGVLGVDGLLDKLRDILAIRSSLYKLFSEQKPDLFVGIDVPDFNLSLEKKLKRHGVKVLHYVSPTVWAWRGYRINKIRESVDHMLTLFPFEARFYEDKNIPVTCVGHPMADEIKKPDRNKARIQLDLGWQPKDIVIAILPGSRRSEIKRLARILIEAANMLHQQNADIKFILPFASERVEKCFYQCVDVPQSLPLHTTNGNARIAMEASDVVILASGTAALEAALLQRVHIVVYRVSKFMHWVLERTRHVNHYSMPNHLLKDPKVPEFMQDEATAQNIVSQVNHYLAHPQEVAMLEQEFAQIHQQLRLDGSARAASVAFEIMDDDAE